MSFLKEFCFLFQRKKYWLFPIILILLILETDSFNTRDCGCTIYIYNFLIREKNIFSGLHVITMIVLPVYWGMEKF